MSIQPATLRSPPGAPPASSLNLERLRDDFPILHQRIHGKPLVYLDNAATTQKPRAVLEAIERYYTNDNANVHRGVHQLSERATQEYEAARVRVAEFIGAADSREIVFCRGTTEGINLVAQTYGRQNVAAGDEVVVTWLEHHSNIVPWQMLCEEKGATLRVAPVDETGTLQLDELGHLLGPRTKLLALAHVSNALGTINPVHEVIALAHQRGIPVLLDGAQAVPHLSVDVSDLDCDFYVFSGHKVYGPTGIGALYGKARLLEAMRPWQGGGDMIRSVTFAKTTYNELPYKFEAGTPNIAGAIGLRAALDYLDEIGRSAIAAHEAQLLERATERLSGISGVRLIGTAAQKAAVVSLVIDHPPLSALDVGTQLDLEGIAVRTGHHCCQPLMDRYGVPGTVRASLALYTTLEEVDRFGTALEHIVRRASVHKVAVESPIEATYPAAAARNPEEAAAELADVFEFLDDWTERYRHIIELGEKLPPLPAAFKTEAYRVHGCQSTVFLQARRKHGTADVMEFLADSDADIVRGLLAILQRLFSGQRAQDVLEFDVKGFFGQLGLDKNLSMGRRNGLAEMVQRIRHFATELAGQTA